MVGYARVSFPSGKQNRAGPKLPAHGDEGPCMSIKTANSRFFFDGAMALTAVRFMPFSVDSKTEFAIVAALVVKQSGAESIKRRCKNQEEKSTCQLRSNHPLRFQRSFRVCLRQPNASAMKRCVNAFGSSWTQFGKKRRTQR